MPFAAAEPANCHGNAEVFVTKHGGEVVRGFLVLHLHSWSLVGHSTPPLFAQPKVWWT